jgi:hypothetical protein
LRVRSGGVLQVLIALLVFVPVTRRLGAILGVLLLAVLAALVGQLMMLQVQIPVDAVGEGGAVTTAMSDPDALFYLVVGLLVAAARSSSTRPEEGGSKPYYARIQNAVVILQRTCRRLRSVTARMHADPDGHQQGSMWTLCLRRVILPQRRQGDVPWLCGRSLLRRLMDVVALHPRAAICRTAPSRAICCWKSCSIRYRRPRTLRPPAWR